MYLGKVGDQANHFLRHKDFVTHYIDEDLDAVTVLKAPFFTCGNPHGFSLRWAMWRDMPDSCQLET